MSKHSYFGAKFGTVIGFWCHACKVYHTQNCGHSKVCVQCFVCEKLHEVESDKYLCFVGNVMIGSGGGVVGDNFNDNGSLKHISTTCRSLECLAKIFELEKDLLHYNR